MSKGSGLTPGGEPGSVTSMTAEYDFTESDERSTEIDTTMDQILSDIIFWGKQDPNQLYYGKTKYEIISDLNNRYKALEKEKENLGNYEDEFVNKEY